MTLKEIASKIKSYPSSRLPVLIAIEGYGGAGKTTFAKKLAAELGDAQIVHLDDFVVKEKILEPSWDKGSFDRDRLERQILRPIRAGKSAQYQKLIWQDNKLSEFILVPPSKYLVIEGISSYHPDIAHYYDFKFWIDAPLLVAKSRGRARDSDNENAAHWDLWADNDLRYQQKYHPELAANFRIPAAGERALVLGGAGSAGYAWEIGVIAGLLEAGLDVTKADLIIGTSAGSTVAVHIAGSTPPTELLAALLAATPRTGPASGPHGGRAPQRPAGLPGDAAIAAASDAADMRRRLGAVAFELDASADPATAAQRRAMVAARLLSQDWPQQPVHIVAVDAHTGEPVVFDRDSGVELADAIAASTSSVGAPPYTIGGKSYIDGGYRRNENADLAAGYERVLVLSPFGGHSRYPVGWGLQLAAQVDELRASGSQVETIFPAGTAHDIFAGTNQMNPAMMPPAAQAGYDQGKALAKELTKFWR